MRRGVPHVPGDMVASVAGAEPLGRAADAERPDRRGLNCSAARLPLQARLQ